MTGLNPAALSKINWTQIIAAAAMLGTVVGFDLDAATQVKIVSFIGFASQALTMVFRTFFTGTAK
jgi:hypothetical protein